MSASPEGRPQRLPVIDGLRGLAALLVCWFHLTNGVAAYPGPGLLQLSGRHGDLGVPIFFVISGFVIPHALHGAGYESGDYGRFLLRRMIRIDVPCYATSLLIIALTALTGAAWGETELRNITALQVVAHLGYLNYIVGEEFFCGVFWSLAIEFQYYLLIGLLLPLLRAPSHRVRMFPFAFLGAMAFLSPSRQLLFHYGFLFLLGIHTFHLRNGFTERRWYALVLPLLVLGVALTRGPLEALAAAATALCIAVYAGRPLPSLALALGSISYSLYLIHPPVGLRLLLLARRLSLPAPLGVLLGLAGSLLAAAALYRFVERPAQRWARLVPYRRRAAPSITAT